MIVRSCAALMLTLFGAGCGWHPLYAPGNAGDPGPVQRGLAQISVSPLAERSGQLLRLALQQRFDRFGLAEPHKYDLRVSLAISSEAIAIQPDNSSTFTRLVGSADWSLLAQTPQRATLASGAARDVDGYNIIVQQYFASDLENEVVQRRIADALADKIAEQLAAYFSKQQVAASQ